MVRLFEYLPAEFTCAALRAPMPIGDHYGWFLLDYFLANDFADVIKAANAVQTWINSVKGQHSSVSLLGYSQGMAMASTLLRLHPKDYEAVVGLSGFVLQNELLSLTESFDTRPPFFWGRDKADLVINEDAIAYTEEWLQENTLLTARTYPGMGHAMSKTEMVDVSSFLRHYVLRPEGSISNRR
jgi:phospholipase/carboxylesterase